MCNKATKDHNQIQQAVCEMDNIEKKFGGRAPEYINMYFAAKLECLTRALIVLTVVLIALTSVYIFLLVRGF